MAIKDDELLISALRREREEVHQNKFDWKSSAF
jgi:hypothetical protein